MRIDNIRVFGDMPVTTTSDDAKKRREALR